MRVSQWSLIPLLAASSLSVSQAWYMVGLEAKKSTKKRPARTQIESTKREPAGAENLFSIARWRRNQPPGIRTEQVERRKRRWILRRIQRGKERNLDTVVEESEEIDQLLNGWGIERVRQTLSIPSCFFDSQEEERRLAAMKLLLERELHDLREKTERFPDVYSDQRLLRFLRKDKLQNIGSAVARYRNFLHWRQENQVDDIRALVEAQPFNPQSKVVAEYIPCEVDLMEHTSHGSVVLPVVLNVGQWKTAAIADLINQKKLTLQDFIRYWIYMFESLHRKLYLESERLQKMVYVDEICDLTDMSIKQFSPGFLSTVLKPWMETTQTYYPETTKRISLFNPPRMLSLVWNIVANLASPGTLTKVHLFPSCKGTVLDFVRFHHTKERV